MPFDFEKGEMLLIDKPLGWTSFDVVNHIRALMKHQLKIPKLKVGHAGTLDPLAGGLLIVCTGKMTKQIQSFQDQDKTYTGTMQMGISTPSFDLETEVEARFPIEHFNEVMLHEACKNFLGEIDQFPPVYSAIKIDGKRAFNYARKNQDVELQTRRITINKFQLTEIQLPKLSFVVDCSKGTYIRSLVSDYGKLLNNGACLTELRRTKIGDFSIENAWNLLDFKESIIAMNSTI